MKERTVDDLRIDLELVVARLNRISTPPTTSGETLVALGEVKIFAKELQAANDGYFMQRRKELDTKFNDLGLPLELSDSMVDMIKIMKLLNDF
ncbi:MAG: hypothetical protein AAGG68_03160 [Bacteroidota bacterium]